MASEGSMNVNAGQLSLGVADVMKFLITVMTSAGRSDGAL